MAGKHNARTTEAPATGNGPAQYTPPATETPTPSGDGPQQYTES